MHVLSQRCSTALFIAVLLGLPALAWADGDENFGFPVGEYRRTPLPPAPTAPKKSAAPKNPVSQAAPTSRPVPKQAPTPELPSKAPPVQAVAPVPDESPVPPPPGDVLPQGMALPFQLLTPVDTATNLSGDPIEGLLNVDIYQGNRLLLPKNTRLFGHIDRLDRPLQGRNAIIGLRMDRLRRPDGVTVAIQSHVKAPGPDHTFGGELTPGTVPTNIIHRVWGIGEYNQIVMAGPRQMGEQVTFRVGTVWQAILEAAVPMPRSRSQRFDPSRTVE